MELLTRVPGAVNVVVDKRNTKGKWERNLRLVATSSLVAVMELRSCKLRRIYAPSDIDSLIVKGCEVVIRVTDTQECCSTMLRLRKVSNPQQTLRKLASITKASLVEHVVDSELSTLNDQVKIPSYYISPKTKFASLTLSPRGTLEPQSRQWYKMYSSNVMVIGGGDYNTSASST
eukprot:TRINITY_DN25878_c0_g1_i1.p1 TRINITY_DN25878_c0_g1~~TRINITY_DN25878_c0_g1_i1.p1  ORF type:complete len:175 (+),score=22.56 TRINITY_DN25878_c0_g1_i1:42-566(+)